MKHLSSVCVFAFVLLSAIAGTTTAADQPKPIRALLVLGGCCHDYDAQQDLIAKGLEDRAHIEVTVVQQGGQTTDTKIPLYENATWADGYDIVLHDECFAEVKDPAWTARILKPHLEGTPAVVIHCAMHSYRDGSTEWFQFCGVTSHGHGAHYPHEVLNLDGEHPIMRDFGAAWANPAGELYHIEKVWPTAHPLASAKNQENGKEEVCVWTNQYGKARVFGTTLGHHNETVKDPAFLDMLARGTLWACDKLNDEYLKPMITKEVPVNLAEGKTATASSEETARENFAKLAIDGISDTRWCAADSSAPQWLQIDLDQPEQLRSCELEWESSSTIYKYRVEGSLDGKSWTVLSDHADQGQRGTGKHVFEPGEARFIRVTFLGSSGGWASLREVRLYGTKAKLFDPAALRVEREREVMADVKVPEGFEATLFAAPPAVNYPVAVAAAPNGDVYVSVDKNGSLDRAPNRGSVLRLRDLDGDGRADEVKRFIDNVDSPRGLVWDHDRLYLMHPPHLSAFIDHDGDGVSDEQHLLVRDIAFSFRDRPADHTSNGVTLGIDGWLYLAIGDFGFMQAEGADGTKLQFRGGGVVRVRPDGSGLQVYSRGTRNILEVGLDPFLNGFSRDNTNDGGGWDIRLHHFSGLENHGYPSQYINFSDEIVQPLADYGGGSGCGTLYMDEPGFPEGYGNALYTADWGQSRVFRHMLSPSGASFHVDQQEFLSTTRVTDLDVDAMSRIFVTSWKSGAFTYDGENIGYLVRVVPKDYTPRALPDFPKLDNLALVKLLESPSHRRRMEAQRELVRRKMDPATAEQLERLAGDEARSLATRVAAVFALKQGRREESAPTLVRLAEYPSLRAFVVRALTDRDDELTDDAIRPVVSALSDDSPRTRLEATVSIARLGNNELGQQLIPLLSDSDPLIAHTAVASLQELKAAEACFAAVDRTNVDPQVLTGALRALQSIHEPAVVAGLIQRLRGAEQPERWQPMVAALCRIYHREGEWKGDSWGTRPDTSGPLYQAEAWAESSRIADVLTHEFANAQSADAAFLLNQLRRNKIKLDRVTHMAIERAIAEPELIAPVIEVLGSTELSAVGMELLKRAAADDDRPAELRAKALTLLIDRAAPATAETIVQGVVELEKSTSEHAPAALERVRDAFVSSPKLETLTSEWLELSANSDGRAAVWADVALLRIRTKKDIPDEVKSTVSAAQDERWSEPSRRLQLIEAMALARQPVYEQQVLLAVKDADPAIRAAAEQLISDLALKPSQETGDRIGQLETAAVINAVLEQHGDPTLGKDVFTRATCVKCHTVSAKEPARGPFLGNIAKTYKRRELAESILLPSKTIAQGFVTNVFLLEDGRTITGFVTEEAADKVVIRDQEGNEHQLDTADIEERTKQLVSVMPEGLVKDLTVTEFASLLDYLESVTK